MSIISGSLAAQYATVPVSGYNIPLIGIPVEATLEECDCCHEIVALSLATLEGTQILCEKCKSPTPIKAPIFRRKLFLE